MVLGHGAGIAERGGEAIPRPRPQRRSEQHERCSYNQHRKRNANASNGVQSYLVSTWTRLLKLTEGWRKGSMAPVYLKQEQRFLVALLAAFADTVLSVMLKDTTTPSSA
jgi:hypothetical protein